MFIKTVTLTKFFPKMRQRIPVISTLCATLFLQKFRQINVLLSSTINWFDGKKFAWQIISRYAVWKLWNFTATFFSQHFRKSNFLLTNFNNWFDEKKICMAVNFSFFHAVTQRHWELWYCDLVENISWNQIRAVKNPRWFHGIFATYQVEDDISFPHCDLVWSWCPNFFSEFFVMILPTLPTLKNSMKTILGLI